MRILQLLNGFKSNLCSTFFFFFFFSLSSASELKTVPVRIVVNADGEMLFYAGMIHDEATAPLRIDVTDSKSFNESMWPYL